MFEEVLDNKYEIKSFTVGPIETNCYAILNIDLKKVVLVDPGFKDYSILNWINNKKAKVEFILLTHGHFDHILGLSMFEDVPTYINSLDEELLEDSEKNAGFFINAKEFKKPEKLKTFNDEILIPFCGSQFKTMHTKGHTKGSSCYIFLNKVIFTGDTLFKNAVGRCDLHGGNSSDIKNSIKKIANIKENLKVLPGHGSQTTLESEKISNIYFK